MEMKENESDLIEEAREALKNSYSPYSKTKVGAAVLTSKGNIYRGCNVESSSYWPNLCAERVAIANAVSNGEKKIKTIAIASSREGYITPCGGCRQVIYEFSVIAGRPIKVILSNKKGDTKELSIEELFPYPFIPKKLSKKMLEKKELSEIEWV
ncbi:cytidine deaminase [Candidatus Micrarchaeota archaeon]|nr:cytidine deaminase [Candidatus Micrarchaeota archaeon]